MTYHFKRVLADLRNLRLMERNKAKRAYIDSMITEQSIGFFRIGEELEEARMTGVRNPECPGDMIGHPDDDFDEDEDDIK